MMFKVFMMPFRNSRMLYVSECCTQNLMKPNVVQNVYINREVKVIHQGQANYKGHPIYQVHKTWEGQSLGGKQIRLDRCLLFILHDVLIQ